MSFEYRERLQEFLLMGPQSVGAEVSVQSLSEEELLKIVRDIETDVAELQSGWDAEVTQTEHARKKLLDTRNRIAAILHQYSSVDIPSKMKQYIRKVYEIQLLALAKTLDDLEKNPSVAKIPELVFSMLESMPSAIPESSRIKLRLTAVIQKLKSSLLAEFHKSFENYLRDGSEESTNSKMWLSFLEYAKDWLLAFGLIYLLPTALSDTKVDVDGRYQSLLDEALTPLWARFHFQLSHARESESYEQLQWTFGYVQSFVEMLIDLVEQITSTGRLQKLYDCDYKDAGIRHIVDKATRFLRAHVANVLATYKPLDNSLCILLIENSLEVDKFFQNLRSQVLTVSSVVYDAKAAHHQWVQLEREHFLAMLQVELGKVDVFAYHFEGETDALTDDFVSECNPGIRSDSLDRIKTKPAKCFAGLHTCLHLFALACERYAYLPEGSQDILCDAIVEPLLCVAVGLLLFRIRTHPVLFAISHGSGIPTPSQQVEYIASSGPRLQIHTMQYCHLDFGDVDTDAGGSSPTSSSKGSGKGDGTYAPADQNSTIRKVTDSFVDLLESGYYFQSCLAECGNASMRTRQKRFEHRWRLVQAWIPKRLISREEFDTEKSIAELIFRSMKADIFAHLDGDEEGADMLKDDDIGKKVGSPSDRAVDVLGSAIELTQKQFVTICSVLEGHVMRSISKTKGWVT